METTNITNSNYPQLLIIYFRDLLKKRMKRIVFIVILLGSCIFTSGQNVQDLIDQVSVNQLSSGLNIFSGETSTTVNNTTVSIINRVSNTGNDLSADYLVEELQNLNNLTVTNNVYSTLGRNVIATQTGSVNPNDIYLICAHYDAVANYCADDNASGTVAILEIARILSQQCVDNTIVYAFWDEEELGLLGARNYANAAAARGDNIKAVLNLDMMGFDGDGDNEFDIDVRNIAGSIAMKDELVALLNTYNSSINLSVNIVDPGTPLSDHKPFWDQNYTAVLLGEAWSKNDQNSAYHTAADRVNLIDMSYYHDMVKMCMAYIATKAGISSNDTAITQSGNLLEVNQTATTYQWVDCNSRGVLTGQNARTLTVNVLGDYAVDVTVNGCTESSDCFAVTSLNSTDIIAPTISVYPNPTTNFLSIKRTSERIASFSIYDMHGKKLKTMNSRDRLTKIGVSALSSGLYFIEVRTSNSKEIQRFIKK
jgi:hypothetical protein